MHQTPIHNFAIKGITKLLNWERSIQRKMKNNVNVAPQDLETRR